MFDFLKKFRSPKVQDKIVKEIHNPVMDTPIYKKLVEINELKNPNNDEDEDTFSITIAWEQEWFYEINYFILSDVNDSQVNITIDNVDWEFILEAVPYDCGNFKEDKRKFRKDIDKILLSNWFEFLWEEIDWNEEDNEEMWSVVMIRKYKLAWKDSVATKIKESLTDNIEIDNINWKKICITWTLSEPRASFEEKIKVKWWIIVNSVTSNTDILIIADSSSVSSKKKQAVALINQWKNISILTEDQLNKVINS